MLAKFPATSAKEANRLFRAGEWQQAYCVWITIAERHPNDPIALVGQVECLQQMKQLDMAESMIDDLKSRFPDNPRITLRHAQMATLRANWPEALHRWLAAMNQQGDNPSTHCGVGVALRELGQFEQADEVLSAAIERFPTEPYCFINHAWTATMRREWPEALRRWEIVGAKFGQSTVYTRGRGLVLAGMNLDVFDSEIESSVPQNGRNQQVRAPTHITSPDDKALLFGRFQSLAENCEFGFVQRHAGLEPLGLFRWAGTPAINIITVLQENFAGIGDDINTDLFVETNGEFWVRDKRYGLRTHTFVFQTTVNDDQAAAFRRKMVKRFRFLKDKAIEDLISGERIFVLKAEISPIPDDVAGAVYDAVAAYGPGWVLHVKKSGDVAEIGSVKRVRDRLIEGFVDAAHAIDYEGWHRICLGALGLRALHEKEC